LLRRAYIGLGSNLGDRAGAIARALLALGATSGVRLISVSRLVETEAVGGPPGQPSYLNAVAAIDTEVEARPLLVRLKEIERDLGREPGGVRWGPRRIDLDLLVLGEQIVREPDLEVPHPRIAERRFVLEPLAELDPALTIPGLGKTVAELRNALAPAR